MRASGALTRGQQSQYEELGYARLNGFVDPDAMPPAPAQYPLLQNVARILVDGIHMAGPDLTAETFARGQFRIPPAGVGPTTPQFSYGNWGFFDSCRLDFWGIDYRPTTRRPAPPPRPAPHRNMCGKRRKAAFSAHISPR